jgi:DNA-binding transcriptional ArsR family regulator
VDAFEALADPVRRSLLAELAGRPRRVVDLADTRPISRPAVSKHLRLLLDAGLVSVAEHGRERYYALEPAGLASVREYVDGLAGQHRTPPITDRALDALETEVRRTSRERRKAAPGTIPTRTEETA